MILVECYGDEALVNYLGFSKADHNFGIGNIAKRLSKSRNRIALIDEDSGKTKPTYFKSLKIAEESNYSVTVSKNENLNNTVISLEPDLEGFLLKILEDTKSKDLLKKHKFPENKDELHSFFMNQKNAQKLRTLLSELELKSSSPRLDALRDALKG